MGEIMTIQEAIEALKHINLKRVHPFYSWEEMMEVRDMAIIALQEKEKRDYNPKLTLEDLQQLTDRTIWWDYFGGECITCKKGDYVVTDDGTFSFDFVLSHGSTYLRNPNTNT